MAEHFYCPITFKDQSGILFKGRYQMSDTYSQIHRSTYTSEDSYLTVRRRPLGCSQSNIEKVACCKKLLELSLPENIYLYLLNRPPAELMNRNWHKSYVLLYLSHYEGKATVISRDINWRRRISISIRTSWPDLICPY